MPLHTPATHTGAHDTTTLLRDADAIMKIAGLTELLATPAANPSPANGLDSENLSESAHGPASPRRKRGAQPRLGQYTAHGLACVFYEVMASGHPLTFNNVCRAIWIRYTDEQLDIIGLRHVRDPQRRAAMSPPADHEWRSTTAGIRLYLAEYQRLVDSFYKLFDGIDDTPIKGKRSRHERPTIAQVARAAENPDLTPKTALKAKVINAIVAASVKHEHAKRYPDHTLHNGLLADHEGHIAVDETHLVVGTGYLGPGVAPGNLMARRHGHSRQYRFAPAMIGLSLAVSVARPTQDNDVPDLILGAVLHHPTGGLAQSVLDLADAIEETGLRRERRSNANQYIIVDGGYKGKTLNRDVNSRGYGLVYKYDKKRRTLFEVGATRNRDGDYIPGVYLFNGKILCPGASRAQLEKLNLDLPRRRRAAGTQADDAGADNSAANTTKRSNAAPGEARPRNAQGDDSDKTDIDATMGYPVKNQQVGEYDGYELEIQEKVEKRLNAYTMPTSGRPRETLDRKRGGQAKNALPPEPVMEVSVTCPARAGKARCAIFGLVHVNDPALSDLPQIPDPPIRREINERPACCNNDSGTMRLRIPQDPFKTWQDFMPGTWIHADWYSGPRAANERANSMLKRPAGGPNVQKGSIAPRKAAPFALAIAAAVAITNRNTMETWYHSLALNEGGRRRPAGHANREERAEALGVYRAKKGKALRAG